jgi:hypothetical protein
LLFTQKNKIKLPLTPNLHAEQTACTTKYSRAILTLGDIHAIFGLLNVLAFDNVHSFGNVHAIFGVLIILKLGVFALLVIALHDMVIFASCK